MSEPTGTVLGVIDMRGDPKAALEFESFVAAQHWTTGWAALDRLTGGGLRRGALWVVHGPVQERRTFLGAVVAAVDHGATSVLYGSPVEDVESMSLRVWRRRIAMTSDTGDVVTDIVEQARQFVAAGTLECVGPGLHGLVRHRETLPSVVVLDDVHLEPRSTALALGSSEETVEAVGPLEALRAVARRRGVGLVVGLDGELDLGVLRRGALPADVVLGIDVDVPEHECHATAWVGPTEPARHLTAAGFDWTGLGPAGSAARRAGTVRGLA